MTPDFTWPVQVPDNPKLMAKLESLVSRSVVIKGQVECAKARDASKPLKIIPAEVQAESSARTSH
jgi:hypothetical protein